MSHGAWVLPNRFEPAHVRELKDRYRALADRRQTLRAQVDRARWLGVLAVATLAAALGYLRWGALHVGSVTTEQLVVVDGTGSVVCNLASDQDGAELMFAHRGVSAATLQGGDTINRAALSPKGSGFGIQVTNNQFTTGLTLHHDSVGGELRGFVSVGANVSSQLSVHGAGNSYLTLSSAVRYGDQSRLELIAMDRSHVDLSSTSGLTKVTLGPGFSSDLELMLFTSPSLSIGRTLEEKLSLREGSASFEVPDRGTASLLHDANDALCLLSDKLDNVSTHLNDSGLLHAIEGSRPAELRPPRAR